MEMKMKGSNIAVAILFVVAHVALAVNFTSILKFSIENGYVDTPSNYEIYKDKL